MKKMFFLIIFIVTSSFAASWHYDNDGCTKVYQYGRDSTECFDKKRDVLADAGKKYICMLTGICK